MATYTLTATASSVAVTPKVVVIGRTLFAVVNSLAITHYSTLLYRTRVMQAVGEDIKCVVIPKPIGFTRAYKLAAEPAAIGMTTTSMWDTSSLIRNFIIGRILDQ